MHAEGEMPAPTLSWDAGWPKTPDEFRTLVDAYSDRLVGYAFRRVGNLQDAEDVVQDVFVSTYRLAPSRRGELRVGPYLYRSVANACTDLLRKRKRSAVAREEIGGQEPIGTCPEPTELALAAEELRRAESLLARLPEAQAEVVRLRVFDELRLGEIADVVGCSVNTVCSRLRYGFRKLRRLVPEERREGR
jgi:RNA polymerase sigma-70 factor (ECF subfamily)